MQNKRFYAFLKNCFTFIISSLFLNCAPAQEKLKQTTSPIDSKVNKETNKFESKEGNFSINISQEPFQTLNMGSELADKKGVDVGKLFLWRFEKTVYTVMYMGPFDRDGNDLPQDWLDIVDGSRKGILNAGGKIISERSADFGKYKGMEFRYLSKEGVKFIGRIYLVNTFGYQLNCGYAKEKDEKEVIEILDSFKLLIEKD